MSPYLNVATPHPLVVVKYRPRRRGQQTPKSRIRRVHDGFFTGGGNREAIGTYSNLGHLCKGWTDLRKRVNESPACPPSSPDDGLKPRSKRFLAAEDITDIVQRYEAGETTQQIGARYGISKTRVATVLREQGITIRRQGLNNEQVSEAAML